MTRRTLEIIAFLIALLVATLAMHAWLASHDEQQRLQSTLAAQKQILDAADASERARQSALNVTLAQIDKLKRATQTPEQILRDLPKYLSLPQPITLTRPLNAIAPTTPQEGIALPDKFGTTQVTPSSSIAATPSAIARSELPSAPSTASSAQIPGADIKPLYDYIQDCRACQAQLAAAQQNEASDTAKITALTRERDAAITASKGGSFWHRLRQNTFWFVVGAGVGAAGGYAAAKR